MLAKSENKLSQIKEKTLDRFNVLNSALNCVFYGLNELKKSRFEEADNALINFERITAEIDNNIVTAFATIGVEGRDLRELIAFLKITNEINRISSNLRAMCKKIRNLSDIKEINEVKSYATELCKCAINSSKIAIDAIDSAENMEEGEIYSKIQVQEKKGDDLYALLENNFTDFNLLNTIRKLEKITDRYMAIAALLEFAKNGKRL
ncbi:MAG: hypothetical protein LBU73_09290 [Helicobacteraceae bacterium]|nr:hypothetical protein [Helicobacteraceae bacterium]